MLCKKFQNRIDGHSKTEHIVYEIGGQLEIECPSETSVDLKSSAHLKTSADLKSSFYLTLMANLKSSAY